MLVLGLESSCDETAAAILSFPDQGCPMVCAECISSQVDLHALYGGVVPELAAREHLKNFPLVIDWVLEKAQTKIGDLTHVAVTAGPGLKGCLLIGVGMGRGVAMARGIPLIPVNHIEGHVLAAMLEAPDLEFPFLALVVSGGHTELIEARGLGDYVVHARTIDDAAGEAFDKSANLLGLEYPGGPRLAALAENADPALREVFRTALPKVMREAQGFSFSGLKTAVALLIKRLAAEISEGTPQAEEKRRALAAAIQDAIVDALAFKAQQSLKQTGLTRLVVTGGVAANKELRRVLSDRCTSTRVFFPSVDRCADNAAMIAYVGALRARAGETGTYAPSLHSRWPLEQVHLPVTAITKGMP